MMSRHARRNPRATIQAAQPDVRSSLEERTFVGPAVRSKCQ